MRVGLSVEMIPSFFIRYNDEPMGLPERRFAVMHVADPPLPHAFEATLDSLGEEHGQLLLARILEPAH